MQEKTLIRSAVLAAVIIITFVMAWELYLRNTGLNISYDDGDSLWSDKRAMVYEPIDKATVFIGSSRNKYDLDIKTWESLTKDHAIQLAMEGTSPLPILDDLANDNKFKGKLVVDVTEILFFSTSPRNTSKPKDNIAYFKKRTPAQRFSFLVNHVLEGNLVFLDKAYYSLNALMDEIPLPKRKGVFTLPWNCPLEFNRITFDRQNIMTNRFLADTTLQNKVKGLWDFYRINTLAPPTAGSKLDSMLNTVKIDVDRILARGGKVMFVRTPSSGPFLAGEKMGFPREKYWDRVLAITKCPGIHFSDYPAIDHFQCPEFSHLKQSDAVIFTQNLVDILQQKGWSFPNKATN